MHQRIILLLPLLVILTACGSSREFAYISDAERDSAQAIISTFASTIHPGDQLYIYVSSQTPESVIPFNEETNKITSALTGVSRASRPKGANAVDGYRVSQDGTIAFPVLGTLSVAGLTHDGLAHDIEDRLIDGGFVNDPVVTVRLMNFRVAVIGEVKKPQELHIQGDRLTIFEALAMCGDITIHGLRDNVTVIRQTLPPSPSDTLNTTAKEFSSSRVNPSPNSQPEVGDRQWSQFSIPAHVGQIDLTSKDLFNSPYYYLQQGDIVYVEPDPSRKRLASRDPNIPNYISLSVSVTRLLHGLYNRYVLDRSGYFH